MEVKEQTPGTPPETKPKEPSPAEVAQAADEKATAQAQAAVKAVVEKAETEPEPPPEPTEPNEEPETKAEEGPDQDAVETAKLVGMTDEEVQEHHKAGTLHRELVRRIKAEVGREPEPEKKPEPEEKRPEGKRKKFKDMFADYSQPEVIELAGALDGALEELDELKAFRTQTLEAVKADMAARAEREFDETVTSLDEEFNGLFGKGTAADFDRKSPEFKRRSQLFEAAGAIRDALAKLGKPPLSMKELIRKAALMEFGADAKGAARKEVVKALEQRREQTIARGDGGRFKPATPTDGAIKAVENKLKELDGKG